MNENTRLEFRFGFFGKLIPLLVAIAFIIYAAVNGSNVNGYVVAFFMAVILGIVVAKDEKAYGQAIISGLTKPMFPVIALAVILAAISGKLISGSGMVQTIAAYAVQAGFTGKLSLPPPPSSSPACWPSPPAPRWAPTWWSSPSCSLWAL